MSAADHNTPPHDAPSGSADEQKALQMLQDATLSQTEDEDDDEAENDDQDEDNGAVHYPGTVIPDLKPDQIEADADLANEYSSDTDYIDLIHLKISSLQDLNLSRFTQLESLCLRQNLLTSVSGMSELKPDKLEELDFYDNRINHISSSINQFTHLTSLDFSFNKIKNIKNIERLTQLQNLYFVQNKIREIRNLKTLTQLKNLELGGNRLEEIGEEMLEMRSVEQLWLGKNKIGRLMNLSNLANLRVLSIQSNRLTKIEGLDKLVNLEELYLSHNGIEDLENLDANTKLTVLDVTSNRLKHLANLSHLKNLTDFWCSYNQISSFDEVEKQLGGLPDLDTVYFEGNPLQTSNPTAYRRKLRLCLGDSLQKIDATYVKS